MYFKRNFAMHLWALGSWGLLRARCELRPCGLRHCLPPRRAVAGGVPGALRRACRVLQLWVQRQGEEVRPQEGPGCPGRAQKGCPQCHIRASQLRRGERWNLYRHIWGTHLLRLLSQCARSVPGPVATVKAVARDATTGEKVSGLPLMTITITHADGRVEEAVRVFKTGEAILGYDFPLRSTVEIKATKWVLQNLTSRYFLTHMYDKQVRTSKHCMFKNVLRLFCPQGWFFNLQRKPYHPWQGSHHQFLHVTKVASE